MIYMPKDNTSYALPMMYNAEYAQLDRCTTPGFQDGACLDKRTPYPLDN